MPTVDNHGVRIGYQVHGQGEPLVLIHGWSCEGRYWDEFGFLPQLSSEFQVVVPDLRAHGVSETPKDGDFSDGAFASDVIAVMDDLAIGSAHMFGYSLGGWVVFELAANFPGRVRSAIAGGAHPYEEDVSAIREFSVVEILDAWEALEAPLSQDSKQRLMAMSQEVLIDIAKDRTDKARRLDNLPMPWLMVCGTEDWRFEEMKRFSQGNARCQFVPVEGLDHLQTWMRPEVMLPSILDFLRSSR